LPERFFTEPIPEGPDKGAVLSRKEVEDTLDEYYELRGWDKATGLPTLKKLNDRFLTPPKVVNRPESAPVCLCYAQDPEGNWLEFKEVFSKT